MKNKKTKRIITAIGYFLLVIALCYSGALIFHHYYYEPVYISGSSMEPTLKGANSDQIDGSIVDFGIVDNHKYAIDHIQRFDIVSTYYPSDYDSNGELKSTAKLKIKRVVAMPNDTFEIDDGLLYLYENGEKTLVSYPFQTNPAKEDGYIGKDTIGQKELNSDEYWVLGDNRSASNDCGTFDKPIKKSYIKGVLVAIEGRAELYIKKYICSNCGKSFSKITSSRCSVCNGTLNADYGLKNKKYHWPTLY